MPETIEKNATPSAVAQQPRLLDQVRAAIRTRHYSLRTEQAYCQWIKRYILFHGKRHPLDMGAPEIEAFLSALATDRGVSASTQNQALAAILFIYRDVLDRDLPWLDGITRAKRSQHLPTVLTQHETAALLRHLPADTNGLIIRLLYGTGMRLLEGLRLRIKDVDLRALTITIRDGKGGKDRITMFPASLVPAIHEHLAARRRWHDIPCRPPFQRGDEVPGAAVALGDLGFVAGPGAGGGGPMIQHWPSVGLPGDACLQKMEVFAKRQQPGYT